MCNFLKLINTISIMYCQIQRVHFIGIGGIGMCGIATILAREGYCVTGSDIICNEMICDLIKLGIKVFFNHQYNNINNADVVVVSSAIPTNNPEIIAAKKANIPVIQRAEMLSEIMRFRHGIAISGTHGKTTTTAMIANIYIEAGLDPVVINGGRIKLKGVYARFGYGRHLIAEVDESDGSFLCMRPIVEVITNIEPDHMDTYQGNFNYLKEAFIKFLHNLPFYGYAIVCVDDMVIRKILPSFHRKIITYGFSKDANFCILNYCQYVERSEFIILCRRRNIKLRIVLQVPGLHNALNATAAIAVAIEEGIENEIILKTMLNFQGTERRFENLGYYSLFHINEKVGKILLIDDYGHHPTELYVTIKTIRVGWPDKRLVMIFQPHRFTRLRDLYSDFVNVLSTVDVLLILDVYPAGEIPILGINSEFLCNEIRKYGKVNPIFISSIQILPRVLFEHLQDNDLLLIQGAGTISKFLRKLIIKI